MDRIRQRKSVRSYAAIPLDLEEIKIINNRIQQGIFGNNFDIQVLDSNQAKEVGISRLTSMGAISGKPAYIFAVVPNDRLSLIDYGYIMENIVLDLTEKGLGTCWIGNMTNRSQIEKQFDSDDNRGIPALISVGKHDVSLSWHQRIREINRHDRKHIDQLFFSNFLGNPLRGSQKNRYLPIFEAIQSAPSTMNRQPWRIVVEGNMFQFYMTTDHFTEHSLELKYLDMGIALSHFLIAIKSMGLSGRWANEIIKPFSKYEYIVSYELTDRFN